MNAANLLDKIFQLSNKYIDIIVSDFYGGLFEVKKSFELNRKFRIFQKEGKLMFCFFNENENSLEVEKIVDITNN